MVITELARAKVNLTLEVLGRRSDGYHELASLVAFADIGDVVTLDTDAAVGVTVAGPFAAHLVGENLISTTLHRLAAAHPGLKLGAVHLEKRLPVAAGIGGGSADAAAVLRAVRRANTGLVGAGVPWDSLAASLGADVPVCLANTTNWMTGIGNRLQVVSDLPGLHAVLVNAMSAVPADKTARVFRALAATPLPHGRSDDRATIPDSLAHLSAADADAARVLLLRFMRDTGNDLQAATQQVVPEVGTVLTELRAIAGVLVAAMSGAGPTCLAVFDGAHAAKAAADVLSHRHPNWWVAATTIG
jgi:4-diphosphocytidyl-2-C-methyl-D-erythritol kinase